MKEIQELPGICRRMRINIIRMIDGARSGHPGGSVSCVEITVVISFLIMNKERGDKLILSKGHASATLYALLREMGILSEEQLKTFRQFGSPLQGHPSSLWMPEVGFSSGMLGQGLSFTNGLAYRAKLEENPRIHFVILGEGDMQYGQTWSAIMTAAQHKLGNVIAIVDRNEYQIGGRVSEIKNIEPIDERVRAFGWLTYRVNGHDIEKLRDILELAANESQEKCLPSMIVAETIKPLEHGKLSHEEALRKLAELGGEPWPK